MCISNARKLQTVCGFYGSEKNRGKWWLYHREDEHGWVLHGNIFGSWTLWASQKRGVRSFRRRLDSSWRQFWRVCGRCTDRNCRFVSVPFSWEKYFSELQCSRIRHRWFYPQSSRFQRSLRFQADLRSPVPIRPYSTGKLAWHPFHLCKESRRLLEVSQSNKRHWSIWLDISWTAGTRNDPLYRRSQSRSSTRISQRMSIRRCLETLESSFGMAETLRSGDQTNQST